LDQRIDLVDEQVLRTFLSIPSNTKTCVPIEHCDLLIFNLIMQGYVLLKHDVL